MCLVRPLDVETVDDNLFVGVTSVSELPGEKDIGWLWANDADMLVFQPAKASS